jgi:hypothetical protein
MSSQFQNLNPNIKTSICKYAFIGCKQQQKCWYAHNKEELRQRYCINGTSCIDNTCCYLHPNKNVDKDEYYLKILLKSDVLGINKIDVKKQLEFINSKIIIEFDNDDYQEQDEHEDNKKPECENDVDNNLNRLVENNEDNEDDNELKNYIENFSHEWCNKPQQFYNLISDKNEITLKIKANDLQFQMISHFMKSMNIEFNIESFIKSQ